VQCVAAAGAQHVGDARGKHAALARELFVDEVGQAVRRQAQIGRQHDAALAGKLGAAHTVPQAHAHVDAAVGQPRGRAGHQGVGTLAAERGEVGHAALVQPRRYGDHAEGATALEVGPDHGRQRHARGCLVAEGRQRHRDLRGTDAGDLDPHLRQGRSGAQAQPGDRAGGRDRLQPAATAPGCARAGARRWG
jgi:hypothetical protein